MKNIVLCFDRSGDTNATALFRLLDVDSQIGWHHHTTRRPDDARASIVSGYTHLVEHWQPGDNVYVFGAGSGASCAQALTRLLGIIGLLDGELLSYMLATYAMPRTRRDAQDWQRVARVAASLRGCQETALPVRFLGLWDTARLPGTDGPVHVAAGRHAVAIDGGPTLQHVDGVDEVWFRGSHRDVVGGPLTLDWMVDGAVHAGLRVHASASGPDIAARASRTVSLRRLPENAVVHASVQSHLRAHPAYWRRLPACVVWADQDWSARGERLVRIEPGRPLVHHPLAAAS